MQWGTQGEEIMKTWAEAQKKVWDDWTKAMKGFWKPQASSVWEEAVEAWADSVRKTLDAQVVWATSWAEGFTAASGASPEMVEGVRRGQDMIQTWVETQKQLWERWFDTLKKLDPSRPNGEREGRQALNAWLEAVQKAIDAQAEWARWHRAGEGGNPTAEGS